MAEKVVSVRLQARVEGFTAGMRKAKASVDDLTKADVPKAAAGYKDLANKAALAGTAIAVGLGVAVKRFAEFDSAMSAVRANTGATGDELESLRQAALKLGADSQFSATEAAQGVNELAKAGVQTQAILGGGLKGALDLAAAGQISVAQAAETTASALTQFNLTGGDATRVADLLTNGANKAQGGVGDLGAALAQTGLVANAMGLSVEETTAGLTAFASAGLIGSDAGTSFKTMIQRLQAPIGQAAVTMRELGISAYDQQGKFVGLANVAGQLQEKLSDLTPEQRNAAMATIFGADAVRAATILYNEGADGIRQWTEEVSKQGAAAKQADDLTDNLRGDIERLGGALDSVFIQTGSNANGSLRTLVQSLEGFVETVGRIPSPLLLAGAGLTAMALVVPKGVKSFRDLGATMTSVGLGLDNISAKAPRTGKALEVAGKGAGVATKALAALAAAGLATSFLTDNIETTGVQKLTADLLTAKDAVAEFDAMVKKNAADQGFIQGDLENFGNVLRATFDPDFLDTFNRKGDAVLGAISLGMIDLTTTTDDAAARLADLDSVLVGLVNSGNTQGAARLLDQFTAAAKAQGVSVDDLMSKLPGYPEALAAVSAAQKDTAGSGSALVSATDQAAQSAEDAKKAWDDLKDAISGLGSPVAEQRAAERDFQQAIDDATASIKENGKTLDENKQKGRENQSSLDAIREATLKKVVADYALTGSTKDATKAMQEGRDAFIDAATQAGMTKKEAKALADQLGLVPKDVGILVSQSGAEAAGAAIDEAARPRTTVITVKRRMADAAASREDRANQQDYGTVRRALGGAIYGAGTGTSDSIPALLSNGEHVLTAAEVAKMGGQSAVYALRAAVRAGRMPAFAAGGAVQYAPRQQIVTVASGPSVHTETNQTPVFVTGPVYANTLGDVGSRAEAEMWRKSVGRQL